MLEEGMLKMRVKNYHQSWVFMLFCVGVIFGTIIALQLRISFFASYWWLAFIMVSLLIAFLKPKILFMLLALIAGMIFAFFRVSFNLLDEEYVWQFYEQTIEVTGVVDGDPDIDDGATKFKLSQLRFGEELNTKNGVLFVSLKTNLKIERADKLLLKGKLSEGFGVYVGSFYRPQVLKLEKPDPGDLALSIRNWFAKRIMDQIPNSEASLGLSYLLGIKTGLSKDLDENLKTAGLIHIVVTSGTHLGILVSLSRKVFGRVSHFFGTLVSIIFISIFMSMVGFTASITRAGIMTILTLLAWYSGRRFSAWRIIVIVAAITLMVNPSNLINLGWLLSFASYAGVMILGPKLCKFFYDKKKPSFIGSAIITSVAATLMTLPIVLYYYGQISLLFVISNLIITPTLPYVMGLSFISGILAGMPFLGTIISFLTTKALEFHIFIVEWFGGMEQFLVKIGTGKAELFLIYFVYGLLLIIPWINRHLGRKVVE
ncbi:ComEC/Rec2 family competence protein [Candidatus Saccharibacteria bacterium]|nr:ComEC/Rec2 family competence protein [Candidatus Saccharibacteria bacterium]